MRFMYQYPESSGADGGMLEPGPVGELAAAAEAAGWEGFAFTEHPVPGARWLDAGGHQTLDPFVALGHAAATTRRLRLLTNLAVAPYRNPFLLAKAAATVDLLSNGRFVLGLGAGYLKGEFHALGVDFDERNALFDEALDVLPLHWSGQPFSYRGRHFDARDVVGRPRPVQDPIPVWIGGNSTRALERVGRVQGWMPMMSAADISATTRTPRIGSIDDLASRIEHVRARVRPGEPVDIAVAYVDPTIAEPARDADRHQAAFAALAAAGVTWVIVPGPRRDRAATHDFITTFARTYLTDGRAVDAAAGALPPTRSPDR